MVANRPLDGFYLGCRGTARFTSLGTMGSELNTDDVRAASASGVQTEGTHR